MSKGKFVPMKVTARFVIGFVARDTGRLPTAKELSLYTRIHPDLFPEAWDLEQAQFALDNPGHILNPGGDES